MLSIKRQVPDGSDEVQQPPKKIKAIQEAEVELEKVVNEAVFKASKPLEDQLSRVMVKVTTLEQTSSRLESAWNGEAGIRLIQTCSCKRSPSSMLIFTGINLSQFSEWCPPHHQGTPRAKWHRKDSPKGALQKTEPLLPVVE
jgi:hypothetical protein